MEAQKLTKAPAFRWWMLIMNMLAYGHFFMTVQCSAAFGSAIQDSLGLNATMLSFYTTAIMISFAFFGSVGGKLIVKVGLKNTVLAALAINVVASVLFIFFGATYISGLVLRFCQGIAGGFLAAAAVNSTVMWFPVRQRALANGILLGVLGIGFTFATLGASALLGAGFAWYQGLGLLVSVSGAVIFVLYLLTTKNVSTVYPGVVSIAELLPEEAGASQAASNKKLPSTMSEIRKTSKYWCCALFGFGNGFLVYGFGTFLSSLLVNDLNITGDLITTVISSTFLITIVAAPLGGIISDNVFKGSRYQTLMIAAAITAISLVLIPVVGGSSAVVVAILLALAYGSVSMVLGPFWSIPNEITTPEISGACCGELSMLANFGGILAAPIFASILDATGTAFICLGICIAVGVVSFIAGRIIHQ